MNLDKLHQAQHDFYMLYPEGFDDPALAEMAKKHKMGQTVEFAQSIFAPDRFSQAQSESKERQLIEDWTKLVTRSSMVSLFEKPKFRDAMKNLSPVEQTRMVAALYELLYGDQATGFAQQVEVLRQYKLAKWSLMTCPLIYVKPNEEVFVKPTTAKGVIKHFELENLIYKPEPSFEFYQEYRKQILAMKAELGANLSPNNAAFSGFLMMSLPK